MENSALTKAVPWAEATANILGSSSTSDKDLALAILSKTEFSSTEEKDRILAGIRWLGLFSQEPIIPRGNPLDTVSILCTIRSI